jgi:hypothetical protein
VVEVQTQVPPESVRIVALTYRIRLARRERGEVGESNRDDVGHGEESCQPSADFGEETRILSAFRMPRAHETETSADDATRHSIIDPFCEAGHDIYLHFGGPALSFFSSDLSSQGKDRSNAAASSPSRSYIKFLSLSLADFWFLFVAYRCQELFDSWRQRFVC